MATPVTLDEFFELAKFGGQITAVHDIFDILNEGGDNTTERLQEYQKNVAEDFKKAQLRFKMGGGKVRMDEDSIESLS